MKLPVIKYVFARKRNKVKSDVYPIELYLSYKSKQKYIATGIRVKLNQWRNNQVVGSLDSIELNKSLDILKNRAWAIVNRMYEEGSEINIDVLADMLKRGEAKSNLSFVDYVRQRINARQVKDNTRDHYVTFVKFLEEYGRIIWFEDLTVANVRNMDEYLRAKGLKETTIYSNYHKHLKMFIRDAYIDRLIDRNPYDSLHIARGQSEQDKYLTDAELHKLENTLVENEVLQRVKDLFLLQCYTGLAYADLMAFDAAGIVKSDVWLYKGYRKKTDIPFTTILYDEAINILEKYHYKLPYIANNRYNMLIKVLMVQCGINKEATSHWARRTTGMVLLNKGVPIELVAKVLGHSNISVTQKVYAKVLDTTMIKKFKELKEKGTL
jgi:integrase